MELLENLDLGNNNNFFQSTFGQLINSGIETGLKALLPDMIEDEIIEIKDTFINEGFSEAIEKTIDTAINFGKSALGIVTGNFESVSQAELAFEKGGIIDGISDAIDFILDKVGNTGLISKNITSAIKNGKDILLSNVSTNIKDEFKFQNENIEKLSKYNEMWKEGFELKDFKKMEDYMEKIEKILSKTMPVENIINQSRTIENLHELIKNNGQNFNLTKEQLELANMLM